MHSDAIFGLLRISKITMSFIMNDGSLDVAIIQTGTAVMYAIKTIVGRNVEFIR